ncbi:hypothetical protein [Hypericibacter sp.]|uniref:hypothetical protein n=1 Tax=Hypericibacter sp. TaxID=2705401 RepID=UPI003D6CCBC1
MANKFTDDMERIEWAFGAIKLIADCYASGVEGSKRIQDITDMLAMGGAENGLRKHVAVAIMKAYSNKPVPK